MEVHSQPAAPYISFMGNLPNHAYVDLTLVGDGADNSVRCTTDLTTSCCTSSQGDWYFPNETTLQLMDDGDSIYQRFGTSRRVVLRRRNNAMGPTGIYRCDIPTNAVHDDSDLSVRETVYVGLYLPSGGIHTSHVHHTFMIFALFLRHCYYIQISHVCGTKLAIYRVILVSGANQRRFDRVKRSMITCAIYTCLVSHFHYHT